MTARKRMLAEGSRLHLVALALPAVLVLSGCDPERDAPAAQTQPPPTVTERLGGSDAPVIQPAEEKPVEEKPAEEVDLIGDKPEAKTKETKAPALLDDLKPSGPLNQTARQCYALLADMKTNIERISQDLDDNGKEVHRLVRTSDLLSKNINDLADLWPDDKVFREMCGTAKRPAILLNDELSRVPRQWTHVRWAFRDTLVSISRLRVRAKEIAELEPKPQLMVGKDGKPVLDKEGRMVYIEPGQSEIIDPATQKRQEYQKKVQSARARERQQEEAKKNKSMPTSLDER